jgi:hypothetical protein
MGGSAHKNRLFTEIILLKGFSWVKVNEILSFS